MPEPRAFPSDALQRENHQPSNQQSANSVRRHPTALTIPNPQLALAYQAKALLISPAAPAALSAHESEREPTSAGLRAMGCPAQLEFHAVDSIVDSAEH